MACITTVPLRPVNFLGSSLSASAFLQLHLLQHASLQPRLAARAKDPLQKPNRRKRTMAEGDRKNWRELCSVALEAKDPDELLKIVQQLNRILKCEEQIRRDFRKANKANQPPEEIRC
jgi:hypothetical protein